jgi:hypothetical protein
MELPDRNANSDDPLGHPYDAYDRTSKNLFAIAQWLCWRLTDPELSPDTTEIMHLEADEALRLGQLNEALETMAGEELDDKLSDPANRSTLKRLTLAWLSAQRRLIDATTQALTVKSRANGN